VLEVSRIEPLGEKLNGKPRPTNYFEILALVPFESSPFGGF